MRPGVARQQVPTIPHGYLPPYLQPLLLAAPRATHAPAANTTRTGGKGVKNGFQKITFTFTNPTGIAYVKGLRGGAGAFQGFGTFTEPSPLKRTVYLNDETAVPASKTAIPSNETAEAVKKP